MTAVSYKAKQYCFNIISFEILISVRDAMWMNAECFSRHQVFMSCNMIFVSSGQDDGFIGIKVVATLRNICSWGPQVISWRTDGGHPPLPYSVLLLRISNLNLKIKFKFQHVVIRIRTQTRVQRGCRLRMKIDAGKLSSRTSTLV